MLSFNNKDLEIATIKANEVVKNINYKNDGLVPTENIIKSVEGLLKKTTPTEIKCRQLSFSANKVKENCGAIMNVVRDGKKKQIATIVINKDNDERFQRFSLVHQLGLLATGLYNVADNNTCFTLSLNIQYNITDFSNRQLKKDNCAKDDLIANIFALKVLMPYETFAIQVFKCNDLQSLANFFGVTKDAVRSRAILGE
jgi:Zn-dependent peptidase ImmA (M78 family)